MYYEFCETYAYVVLQYTHDVSVGEHVNVGVLMIPTNSDSLEDMELLVLTDFSRLKAFFGLNTQNINFLKDYLKHLKVSTVKLRKTKITSNESSLDETVAVVKQILQQDDSAIHWMRDQPLECCGIQFGCGIVSDNQTFQSTHQRIFNQFVKQPKLHKES